MEVIILKVKFNYAGNESILYPVVLHNRDELVLVDCGYPNFILLIEAAMQEHLLSLSQLTGIIITHHDIDHVGALFEIKTAYPHIKVYSSVAEANTINGKEKSARLIQAEHLQASLPVDKKEEGLHFIEMLKAIKPVPVDAVLKDGEIPSFLPGIQIIYTPGHMPGHISLYDTKSKTLIAADALVIENGELEIANAQFTIDMHEAIRSVKKIAQLEIAKAICYHGGVMEQNIAQQLQKLIEKYEGHLVK